jgi:hypothetical protein
MRKGLLTVLIALNCLTCLAQDVEVEGGFQKEKLFVGGNFALTFGNVTLINISPQVGYRFSRAFAAGLGINGQYINQRLMAFNGQEVGRVRQGVVGLNIFGRVYPIENILLQVQPEANYVFGNESLYGRNPETTKLDAAIVPSLLLGGGLVMPSGGGSFIVSVFFDVLRDQRSPYGNRPIYNFGYNVNLGGGRNR